MTDATTARGTATFDSWGRLDRRPRQAIRPDTFEDEAGTAARDSYLPFGNGRSYGDSCHNDAGVLIDNRSRGRIHAFDPGTGMLSAEAGVTLSAVLSRAVPHRFFLPVTPGTAHVTLGGAVANDVHGKNHHQRGTFGNHVRRLTLLRSDGRVLTCSDSENPEMFRATIGGMGLTGLILDIDLQLMKVPSAHIQQHTIRFDSLDAYFHMIDRVDAEHEYSVAWIDQLATGRKSGRGILLAGDHADASCDFPDLPSGRTLGIPATPPVSLLNRLTLKAFNAAYLRRAKPGETAETVKWSGYFYPLDAIRNWNRLYGPKGLYQHQSVYPADVAPAVTANLLETARAAGHGSFLTVLKRFGDHPSRGLLSFPRPGFTLTLDFANQGESTLRLLDALDRIVVSAGGAVNPYKDARMSPQTFAASFPEWTSLEAMRDPAMMSNFWRRTAMAL
ncbi:FAD-linked oxidase [Rhizobium sp. Leaf384]|uniref:FAD-binding oxidoreductase n=1 Tax=unclassified Rhizobium TaxID=2613769 RepID=UPI000715F07D|nr:MULTISPECIES: FAD-binding oxidoreductase [unclassified Rhizobium]KQS74484.1 FAD-linked oxidase [Rhizobium sp. Leaf383]KQS80222.1 FAD-linked oxidase [Rhizobium sp. Leaf384]